MTNASATTTIEISVVAPMHNEEGCVEEFLRRTDERAGTVHVHFPRVGFTLKKASA